MWKMLERFLHIFQFLPYLFTLKYATEKYCISTGRLTSYMHLFPAIWIIFIQENAIKEKYVAYHKDGKKYSVPLGYYLQNLLILMRYLKVIWVDIKLTIRI